MVVTNVTKTTIPLGFTLGCILLVFIIPPIAQDPAYHHFADNRSKFGISNFYNVISNIPFLVLGLLGPYFFLEKDDSIFSTIILLTLFVGVMGIAIGSSYYHLNPTNSTLVWDRIPMTITFMSFLSVVIHKYVNRKMGLFILFPLLLTGIVSVISWYRGEMVGAGDLRLYALVQFYPMIAVPLIIFLYPTTRPTRVKMAGIILLYVVAKVFEHYDSTIFNMGQIISGHSIKHVFASGSILLILLLVKEKKRSDIRMN